MGACEGHICRHCSLVRARFDDRRACAASYCLKYSLISVFQALVYASYEIWVHWSSARRWPGNYARAHASTGTQRPCVKIHNSRSAIVTTAAARGVACAPQASGRARNERARDDCLTPPPAHAATLGCCSATQLRPRADSYERSRSRRALSAMQRAHQPLNSQEVADHTVQWTCAKDGVGRGPGRRKDALHCCQLCGHSSGAVRMRPRAGRACPPQRRWTLTRREPFDAA